MLHGQALLSKHDMVQAVLSVATGVVDRAFVNVRPPGHHACCDTSGGFCHLNNAATAARTCLANGKANRIAIMDWDM